MKHIMSLAVGGIVVAGLFGALQHAGKMGGTTDHEVELLDPAKVELIRTPGGFLQLSAMGKVEEFGWQTAWTCPFLDCTHLPKTISKVRVKAHYVYGIPLAAEWRLEPEGDHYRLTVPPLRLQRPVAFDTTSMEVVTTESSLLSPAAPPNRENAVRHLGPELAQRGSSPPYLNAQQRNAEQTVREFARKWMLEQGRKIERPIKVVFSGPDPA